LQRFARLALSFFVASRLGRAKTISIGSTPAAAVLGESRFIDESGGDAVTDGHGPQDRKLLFKQTRFSNFRDGYRANKIIASVETFERVSVERRTIDGVGPRVLRAGPFEKTRDGGDFRRNAF